MPTPREVALDDAAFEIAREWIGKKKMTGALSLGRYLESGRSDEPAIWGVILADLARHVARGLRAGYSLDEQATLAAMSKTFEKELRAPSSPLRTSKIQ